MTDDTRAVLSIREFYARATPRVVSDLALDSFGIAQWAKALQMVPFEADDHDAGDEDVLR